MSRNIFALFLLIYIFRLWNAFSLKTFSQPDEFYQALEPAHAYVFGYGYISWEWKAGLRSVLYPALYALVYSISDSTKFIIHSPKFVGALVAALGDIGCFLLGSTLYGSKASFLTLFLSLSSAFQWMYATRSLSNSLESTLTALALANWSFDKPSKSLSTRIHLSILCASIGCIIRPTNILIWAPLGAQYIFRHGIPWRSLWVVGTVFFISFLMDSYYYRQWSFPPYNFFQWNVIQGLSSYYGQSPFHAYITSALPQLLVAFTPLTLYALYLTRSHMLTQTFLFVLLVFSCISHKEARFLMPTLPILHVQTAHVLAKFNTKTTLRLLFAFSIIHVIVGYYIGIVHQRGVMEVMEDLRQRNVQSVTFLMPCHSTPWHAYVHQPDLQLNLLTCHPPLKNNSLGYLDEADKFYNDPLGSFPEYFSPPPDAVVFFQALQSFMEEYVKQSELPFRECGRYFNSHWMDDLRREGDVIMYCYHQDAR